MKKISPQFNPLKMETVHQYFLNRLINDTDCDEKRAKKVLMDHKLANSTDPLSRVWNKSYVDLDTVLKNMAEKVLKEIIATQNDLGHNIDSEKNTDHTQSNVL